MDQEECLCSDTNGPHYWEWCESCELFDTEVKCPIHYKET